MKFHSVKAFIATVEIPLGVKLPIQYNDARYFTDPLHHNVNKPMCIAKHAIGFAFKGDGFILVSECLPGIFSVPLPGNFVSKGSNLNYVHWCVL